MKKKTGLRQIVMLFLILVLLIQGVIPVCAAQTGSIAVTLEDKKNQKLVTGGEITLYQVAALVIQDNKAGYKYVNGFEDCGISLEDLSDSGLAEKLDQKRPDTACGTAKPVDEQGQVKYTDLEEGLYLLVQTKKSEGYEMIRPFLVSLPMETEYGWNYEVDASPKVETLIPDTPDKPNTPDTPNTPGTPGHPGHPGTSIITDKTPGTSNPDAGSVKEGRQELSFIHEMNVPWHERIYNELPQTGQLNWPIPVLSLTGLLLFSIGWILKKEEKKK